MFWESFRAENFGKSGLFTPAHLSFSRCCRNTDKPSAPDVDNATTFPVAPTSTSYIPHARGPRLPGRTPKFSHFPGISFSPAVGHTSHQTRRPRYQKMGIIVGHRTVIGFMWVGTTASEMWGIPSKFSRTENSRLISTGRREHSHKYGQESCELVNSRSARKLDSHMSMHNLMLAGIEQDYQW